MVGEVRSPTTRGFDTFEKRAEYKQVESLDYIMFVDPKLAYVDVWSRGPDRGWVHQVVEGLDGRIAMPAIGVTLSLAEIYGGVVFPPPGIRLVRRVEAAEGARPASGP